MAIAPIPVQQLPDFMTLDFDPERGILIGITPLGDEKMVLRTGGVFIEKVTRNTFLTLIVQIAMAALNALTVSKPIPIKSTLVRGLSGGVIGGAIMGYFYSKNFISRFYEASSTLTRSSVLAKDVMQTFIDNCVDAAFVERQVDIRCPLSFQVMAYPVKTRCVPDSSSATPHTFEYNWIFQELSERPHCPTCRQIVHIQDLSLDRDRENIILEVASQVFLRAETILENFETRTHTLLDFSAPQTIDDIRSLTRIFANDAAEKEAFLARVSHPETLSRADLYALTYHLVHQFSPMRKKIETIWKFARICLTQAGMGGHIPELVMNAQLGALDAWYQDFQHRLIPAECTIVRRLYTMPTLSEIQQGVAV